MDIFAWEHYGMFDHIIVIAWCREWRCWGTFIQLRKQLGKSRVSSIKVDG